MTVLGIIGMIVMWIGIIIAAVYYCFIDEFRPGWLILAILLEYFFARAIYGMILTVFA